MSELPKATIKRIVTRNGAVRISDKALNLIIDDVEEYIADISNKVIEVTEHANRSTIQDKDVKLVL